MDGAGVLWGRRAGTGKFVVRRRQESDGWFRERREKMARRGESPGCQDGKGRQWYPRTGRNAAPGRGAEGACRVGPAPEGLMPEGEGPAVCAVPKPHGASACPGPKGMSAFNDSGPYPFAESLALMKRAGRGRDFEGGGDLPALAEDPPPSRKQPPLLRAGDIRASGR